MGLSRDTRAAVRKDAAAATVIRAWRALTGGREVRDEQRRTLIACSGGCDSSALVLVLAAAAPEHVVVAHVLHDLRTPETAGADRDAVRALAGRVGVGFCDAAVAVKTLRGNAEANARGLRYAALARLAWEQGCGIIVTGHQGDDLLETMLMRLMRGAGPRGLAAIREVRGVEGVRLVRPMLGVTRADTERVCRVAGHQWRHDATNDDGRLLRNAVRQRVVPMLKELKPEVHARAVGASRLLGETADVVRALARDVLRQGLQEGDAAVWARSELRAVSGVVLGEWLRLAAGAGDRVSQRSVREVVRRIRSDSTEPRKYVVGGAKVQVTARGVRVMVPAASLGAGKRNEGK